MYNSISAYHLYLNEKVKQSVYDCVFEMNQVLISRFGTGLENSVFTEHLSRGFTQIRKGIPLQVFLAAVCDPRTKDLGVFLI